MFGLERTAFVRAVLFVCLLGLLAVLCVWAGTLGPNPATNSFAGEDEWGPTPENYLGERVSVTGIVVSTDPIVITVDYGVDSTMAVTVRETDTQVHEGQEFGASGPLVDARTVEAERTNHRDRWEVWYMYGISFLGGCWVLFRLIRDWSVETSLAAFVPRGETDD